jgi:hypothetical protein
MASGGFLKTNRQNLSHIEAGLYQLSPLPHPCRHTRVRMRALIYNKITCATVRRSDTPDL